MGLLVYENEVTEWVVAESEEDARAVLRNYYKDIGMLESDTPPECFDLTVVPDMNKPFTINDDDCQTQKTFAEWAASNGRGFLASTEY